jgi:hypothetical protein
MSLNVTEELVAAAEADTLTTADFVACVRDSLPYFYARVEKMAAAVNGGQDAVINEDEPQTDEEWNQLLRGFASDPIRDAMEEHFGIALAFRNCCAAGATKPENTKDPVWQQTFSKRQQVLQQRPALRNC